MAGVLVLSVLSACGSSNEKDVQEPMITSEGAEAATSEAEPSFNYAIEVDADVAGEVPAATAAVSTPKIDMTQKQRNSINMLNYLTVLVQEIQESKNSRLFLESAYSELLNNTEPSIVDDLTLDEYEKILTIIENYRMTTVQRERLQYIYEQNQASAIRSALPNPLAALGVAQAGNPLKAIVSLAYAAVDSANSYNTYTKQIDLQYLQNGWALDDSEAANLHDSRTSMFSYMVRVSRDLPTGITLSEEAVNEFVEWKNKDNVTSRIRWLESNQATYCFFGEYWLALAESYYENEDYEECLDAVAAYEALDNSIFRKDIRFAQTLPYAIVAATETLEGDAYIEQADHYAQLMVENTNNSDWSLRYFAAQTYADLYGRTSDRSYLQRAFDLAYDNVNELVPKQYELNRTYLADVAEAKADEDADKAEKETINAYNDLLKETRKTELPPIYEPLLLNCELLRFLAEQLDIGQVQLEDIDKILHPNGERLFLNIQLDEKTYFSVDPVFDTTVEAQYADGVFSAPVITIPVLYVPDEAEITMTVTGTDGTRTYDDWTLVAVDRVSDAPENFIAKFSGNEADHASFADGDMITVLVVPPARANDTKEVSIQFQVHKESGFLGWPYTVFERIDP